MTIHSSHPFRTDDDAARRLRARLGGAVTLVTAHDQGLTVSSVMIALGEPPRLLMLLDPDAALTDELRATGRGVVQLLAWGDRDLSEAFAGQSPAPGGPFRLAEWESTGSGRRLRQAATWAEFEVESFTEAGWSMLCTARLGEIVIGADREALEHRRGRYRKGDCHE